MGNGLRRLLPVGFVAGLLLAAVYGLRSAGADPADSGKSPAAGKSAAADSSTNKDSLQPADAASEEDTGSEDGFMDPLGPNAACYVCHMTFVWEELASVHLPEKITCIKCHGLSAPHANDENVGATKPDIIYARKKIDSHCKECHDTHDAPAKKVIAQWLEIGDPKADPVCTECHGSHKIEEPELEEDENTEADTADGQQKIANCNWCRASY